MKLPKKTPKWVKAVPESQSHGTGSLQRRLFRLVSDYVRIRDWHLYGGRCVATGAKIGHWSEGDAGHFKSYSVCNGMFKFDPRNIHLQSKSSNGWGGQEIGYAFGEELKLRYNDEDYMERINAWNRDTPLKFTDGDVIRAMEDIISKMNELPEQPKYFERVLKLMDHER